MPLRALTFDYASADKAVGTCPLCASADDFEPLAAVDRYDMGLATVGCRRCGLVQTNPRLTAAALDRFYARDYREYYQGVVHPDEAYVRAQRKDVRLDRSTAYLRQSGLLDDARIVLDVGCSEGAFFAALRRAGATARLVGIEPNDTFRLYAQGRHGAEVVASEFDLPDDLAGRVDLAVIVHVLEHLADPVGSLARLRRFLAPGGAFYVDVPDIAAYASVDDLHIAHVWHFGTETLGATLLAAGYDVVSIDSYRPAHHPPSLRAIARARTVVVPVADSAAAQAAKPDPEPLRVRTGWVRVAQIGRMRRPGTLKRIVKRWFRQRAANAAPLPPP